MMINSDHYFLKDCIYKIKIAFNKQFSEILKAKDTEIRRIQERNARIQKITRDLEMDDDNFTLSVRENDAPESLLEVRDEEITVEKFIGEEERKRMEEEAKLEEGAFIVYLSLVLIVAF